MPNRDWPKRPDEVVWSVPARATLMALERGDHPDRDWPRGATAREAIAILADRYRRGEPIRPVIGHEQPNGRVTLLIGQLRFAAAMSAGITAVPAYVIASTLSMKSIEGMLAQIRAAEIVIPTDPDPLDGQHRTPEAP